MIERLEAEDPNFEILFTPEEIDEKVSDLGLQISKDYSDSQETPLILMGVLKGATPFLVDLARSIQHPNLYIDYIGVTSYSSNTFSSREPQITLDSRLPIMDKNVIVVEDTIDTGYSIRTLLEIFQARKPKTLRVCALLSKPTKREVDVPIDYIGFEIDDLWVQGYGLDTNERGRNWPYIAYRK